MGSDIVDILPIVVESHEYLSRFSAPIQPEQRVYSKGRRIRKTRCFFLDNIEHTRHICHACFRIACHTFIIRIVGQVLGLRSGQSANRHNIVLYLV